MELLVGIDLHSNNAVCGLMDERGRRLVHQQLPCDLPAILPLLDPYQDPIATIAIESTFNWYWLVDGLQDHGYHVVLANPRHTVIRTSLNGGTSPTGDRGFNEQMRRAWEAGQTLTLFTDEFRSPIHAALTARAAWELARQGVTGIWHLAGAERLSRFQIGELLAARWPRLKPTLRAGSLRDYTGGPRPPDTSLNCARAQARLSFKLAGFEEWLRANPAVQF